MVLKTQPMLFPSAKVTAERACARGKGGERGNAPILESSVVVLGRGVDCRGWNGEDSFVGDVALGLSAGPAFSALPPPLKKKKKVKTPGD